MIQFIQIILFVAFVATPLYNENIQTEENIVDESMVAEKVTVEGIITAIYITDLSKTSRVKNLHTSIHLKTPDSPHEINFRRHTFESDKELRVGQRVSITAYKPGPDFPENAHTIIHIDPL